MTKLEELKKMLDEVGITLEKYKFPDGTTRGVYQVKIYDNTYAIFNETSKGGFRLEIQPHILKTPFEKAISLYSCLWLELDELFKRIKYCVENNTDTYVEVEEFNVGDEVYVVWKINTEEKIYKCLKGTKEYNIIDKDAVKPFSSRKITFISHSKRKCLEHLFVQSHKRELKEKEIQERLLEEIRNEN